MSVNEKEINSMPASSEADPSCDSAISEINQKVPQIRVLVKEPGKDPKIQMVDNTLKALQNLVGGYIETVELDHGVCLICNENGKIIDLPENFWAPWDDTIVGTAVFVSFDDDGNFAGISDEQIDYAEKFIKGECL